MLSKWEMAIWIDQLIEKEKWKYCLWRGDGIVGESRSNGNCPKWISCRTDCFCFYVSIVRCTYTQMQKLGIRTSIKVLNGHNNKFPVDPSLANPFHLFSIPNETDFSQIAMQPSALLNYCEHSPLLNVPFAYYLFNLISSNKKKKYLYLNLHTPYYDCAVASTNVWYCKIAIDVIFVNLHAIQ